MGIRAPTVLATLLLGLILLAGCASRNDLIAAGLVVVEPRIDQNLRTPPKVYEEAGNLVVYGTIEMRAAGGLAGHVDVSVSGPDGAMLYDAQANYRADTTSTPGWTGPRHGVFHRAHRRNASFGVYAIRFPGLPPEGSVVKVRHDLSLTPASTASNTKEK